jgi:hypothetical protein
VEELNDEEEEEEQQEQEQASAPLDLPRLQRPPKRKAHCKRPYNSSRYAVPAALKTRPVVARFRGQLRCGDRQRLLDGCSRSPPLAMSGQLGKYLYQLNGYDERARAASSMIRYRHSGFGTPLWRLPRYLGTEVLLEGRC